MRELHYVIPILSFLFALIVFGFVACSVEQAIAVQTLLDSRL